MGDLRDDDILEWSEWQARLLRDVAARENAGRLSQGRGGFAVRAGPMAWP